jgi:hypothetical protein
MTKTEDKKEIVLSTEMEVVLEGQKDSLTNIHENMGALILKAEELSVDVSDKDSYDNALELKREIKATHIKVKKKRNELKKPLIVLGRKLDAFTATIYDPLVNAEKLVKTKMEGYEKEQDRIKTEQKDKKENEGKEREQLDQKLHDLNAMLGRINECKTQAEVVVIEQELSDLNLKDFGERSDEAGFILGNLTQTCGMVKKSLPEGEPVVEEEKKEEIEVVEAETVEEPKVKVEGDTIVVPKEMMKATKEQKDTIDAHEQIHISEQEKNIDDQGYAETQGELDFGAVADAQAKKKLEPAPVEEKYFSPNEVDEILSSSVYPMAVFEGEDEKNVSKVLSVMSVSKGTGDLPSKITIGVQYPDGETRFGRYVLVTSDEEEE